MRAAVWFVANPPYVAFVLQLRSPRGVIPSLKLRGKSNQELGELHNV
jgi:hypothetical protein